MPATSVWLRSLLPFVVMCFGGFMALLDIQIVASSLQQIGGGLSAAQDQIAWVQTAYLIAEIVVIPLSGRLTRVFSTRWLFTASAAGFTAASLLCGLAWNIESMIVFRALQGLLGASMIPIVFTSSFYYFEGPRRVYSAAVIGTIASVAPTLGPVVLSRRTGVFLMRSARTSPRSVGPTAAILLFSTAGLTAAPRRCPASSKN